MIQYDAGKWNLAFAFSLNGSVFPKAMVVAFPSSIFAGVLNWWMHQADSGPVVSPALTNILSGFTFILGFLIVFRSQVAYSRWWEGATILQKLRGEWFNAFSSLMAFCNPNKSKQYEVLKFQHQLIRLMSLLYASALQQVGSGFTSNSGFELISIEGFDVESIRFLESSQDRCEIILQWIQRLIVHANNAEVIRVAPPILSRVYNQLGNGIVNLNNARKIAEYNIPFCLAQMITFMLCIHWLITPIMCASAVETPAMAGVLSFVVIFSFWSITYIATEIEIPYGSEPNDLPLDFMQKDLNRSLISLLHPMASEPPEFEFAFETHRRLETVYVDLDNRLIDVCVAQDSSTCEAPEHVTVAQESKDVGPDLNAQVKVEQVVPSTAQALPPRQEAQARTPSCPFEPPPVPPAPPMASIRSTISSGQGLDPTMPKTDERLDGVTKVLDIFSEALVTSSIRIEKHLAYIHYTMEQLGDGLHAGSLKDSPFLCAPLLRSDVPGTPDLRDAPVQAERTAPRYNI